MASYACLVRCVTLFDVILVEKEIFLLCFLSDEFNDKQEMLQYVTNAPEGPLCATHLLIMLYLSVMFR